MNSKYTQQAQVHGFSRGRRMSDDCVVVDDDDDSMIKMK